MHRIGRTVNKQNLKSDKDILGKQILLVPTKKNISFVKKYDFKILPQ